MQQKINGNIRFFNYSLQLVLLMRGSGWEHTPGRTGGNKPLSRKSEGIRMYVCAAELLLLYSLTQWGKWLFGYCSYLLSYVGKATTWTTQPRLCLAWQVGSEREDAVWEMSASQPSPWWQGSLPTSKCYKCLFLFIAPGKPGEKLKWWVSHLMFPGLWQSSRLCVVSMRYHMEQNSEKWNANTTSVMVFFSQRASQI